MMERSWFSNLLASSSSKPTSPRYNEPSTPRWHTSRTNGPTSTNIPPPMVSSTIIERPLRSSSSQTQRPSRRDREQQRLESDLRAILDAQGQCLSFSLTSDNAHQESRRPDLHALRKALYTSIRKLAIVKYEDMNDVLPEIHNCEAKMTKLDELESAHESLQTRISESTNSDEKAKANEIRSEANRMQADIDEAEAKLVELKTIHKRLNMQADLIESRIDAKTRQYTVDLSRIEAQMAQLVNGEPVKANVKLHSPTRSRSSSAWSSTARHNLEQHLADLQSQHEAAERHHEALEQGAIVWRDVVRDLTNLENMLTKRIRSEQSVHDSYDREMHQHDDGQVTADDMRTTLRTLDQVIEQLDNKHRLAEARDWNLLICAIGAELEALRKGKEVLEEALGEPGLDDHREPESDGAGNESYVDGDELHDLDAAFRSAGLEQTTDHDNDNDHDHQHNDADEDDGPDPNLLISHQDLDHDA